MKKKIITTTITLAIIINGCAEKRTTQKSIQKKTNIPKTIKNRSIGAEVLSEKQFNNHMKSIGITFAPIVTNPNHPILEPIKGKIPSIEEVYIVE